MRKTLVGLVVFAFLVGVAPANAQGIWNGGYVPSSPEGWYYYLTGNQVMILQADNLHMIDQFMGMGRRAQLRRVTDDLVGYGPYVGLNGPQGFYPMYQCSSKKRRIERGIGTALIGAGIGYLGARITGTGEWEGALSGAAIAGGYAMYKDSACQPVQNNRIRVVGLEGNDEGDDQTMVVQPPNAMVQQPVRPQVQPPSRENGWNQRLRQQQAGIYQRGQIGGRPVNNRTGLDVILWVGNSMEPLIIGRGGHTQVSRNPGGMEAETIETAPGGNEVRRPALVVPNHDLDGWDIIVPAGR